MDTDTNLQRQFISIHEVNVGQALACELTEDTNKPNKYNFQILKHLTKPGKIRSPGTDEKYGSKIACNYI